MFVKSRDEFDPDYFYYVFVRVLGNVLCTFPERGVVYFHDSEIFPALGLRNGPNNVENPWYKGNRDSTGINNLDSLGLVDFP